MGHKLWQEWGIFLPSTHSISFIFSYFLGNCHKWHGGMMEKRPFFKNEGSESANKFSFLDGTGTHGCEFEGRPWKETKKAQHHQKMSQPQWEIQPGKEFGRLGSYKHGCLATRRSTGRHMASVRDQRMIWSLKFKDRMQSLKARDIGYFSDNIPNKRTEKNKGRTKSLENQKIEEEPAATELPPKTEDKA